MGSAHCRFFGPFPPPPRSALKKPSLKSLFQNTLPVTYSFHRLIVLNFRHPHENKEFRGRGEGVPVYRFIVR